MLSRLIPIFPLPDAILFPHVFLPLHIFEPRYRQMVADALDGDRIIGMVLLRPGWEADYHGRPPVYPVGCAGLITHAEPLPDGRYNIVLRGLERFRLTGEDHSCAYRRARTDPLPDGLGAGEREAVRAERRRLESLLAPRARQLGASSGIPAAMPDEELINALAQYLDFEPVERQALLECDGPLCRCQALIELLEMKLIAAERRWQTDGRR